MVLQVRLVEPHFVAGALYGGIRYASPGKELLKFLTTAVTTHWQPIGKPIVFSSTCLFLGLVALLGPAQRLSSRTSGPLPLLCSVL